jgi:signal transduction histidine kinase
MALDISALEQREDDMATTVLGSAILVIALLAIAIAWGVGRLVRPLSDLALRIGALRPDRAGQRIEVDEAASSELLVIADALNDYLRRNERFVQRERAFVDSASHELRTPIAVIAGAAELALGQPELPPAARTHLSRIQRTARDVEQLITLLLVLAKDPARLAGVSERVALEELLPAIVEDHRHLTRDKDLRLALAPMPPCSIAAPVQIVQAAIGNLLRNAIEHSDRGVITIRLDPPATVTIEDPGHGMTPEEISAIYARMARSDGGRGGGIGLDLIARLCEHLGWDLVIASDVDKGTRTTLDLAPPTG